PLAPPAEGTVAIEHQRRRAVGDGPHDLAGIRGVLRGGQPGFAGDVAGSRDVAHGVLGVGARVEHYDPRVDQGRPQLRRADFRDRIVSAQSHFEYARRGVGGRRLGRDGTSAAGRDASRKHDEEQRRSGLTVGHHGSSFHVDTCRDNARVRTEAEPHRLPSLTSAEIVYTTNIDRETQGDQEDRPWTLVFRSSWWTSSARALCSW